MLPSNRLAQKWLRVMPLRYRSKRVIKNYAVRMTNACPGACTTTNSRIKIIGPSSLRFSVPKMVDQALQRVKMMKHKIWVGMQGGSMKFLRTFASQVILKRIITMKKMIPCSSKILMCSMSNAFLSRNWVKGLSRWAFNKKLMKAVNLRLLAVSWVGKLPKMNLALIRWVIVISCVNWAKLSSCN